MAEIIDIRGRLQRRAPEDVERKDGGLIYRLRICGPDLRWLGLVSSILGRTLVLEGFYTSYEDAQAPVAAAPYVLCLRAGREIITETGADRCPGLVVCGTRIAPAVLHGCDRQTVLLLEGGEMEALRHFGFSGTVVPLPVSGFAPETLEIGLACVGGASRLLGMVRWTALEQALREELAMYDNATVNRHLAFALEAFDRTSLWAGRVSLCQEEIS